MKGAKELTVFGNAPESILNIFDSVLCNISCQQQITAHQLDY